MEEQLRVLVVDDDAVDRMAVRRSLRAVDTTLLLAEAENSEQALTTLATESFDCVLLDYQLPGINGLDMLRELRTRGLLTPVVMLTGQGDEQLAVEIMKAGAVDYLNKSAASGERLIQSVRNAVRVHRAEQQVAQAQQALRESVERLWFLAEASRILAAGLDAATILRSLAELVVPWLADWCAVDVVEPESVVRRLTTAVPEGSDEQTVQAIDALLAYVPDAPSGPAAVIRSVLPAAYPALAQAQPYAPDEEHVAALDTLGIASVLCVPLLVRGRVLGALTLAITDKEERFGEADLQLARDLGQRSAVALDNAELYRTAQDAVRLRDAFLATASHELKTPLTSLYGNVQLLERRTLRSGVLDERDQRIVRVIVEQSARLDRMISALLDISRLQTGQLTIQQMPLDLRHVVQQTVDELELTLDKHTFDVQSDAEPLIVAGDPLRLHQVIQNLVQNAIKYSPEGGVVTLRVARQDAWATMAISDQGMGIPADALPHLFSQFYRASNVNARQISGIGLGLYVVKEIVTLHRGTVTAESTEGQGSTFTVRLPLLGMPDEERASEG